MCVLRVEPDVLQPETEQFELRYGKEPNVKKKSVLPSPLVPSTM